MAGWKTARVQRPVQILGSLDGIEIEVRQLIREEPLETMLLDYHGADKFMGALAGLADAGARAAAANKRSYVRKRTNGRSLVTDNGPIPKRAPALWNQLAAPAPLLP